MLNSKNAKAIKLQKFIFFYMLFYLLFFGCDTSENSFRGTKLGENMPAEDFTLTDQFGNEFTLSDHRGEVVLLFFGFTYCPDVCPATLSTWKRVEEALSDNEQVKFVYITVDPERDTQEKLRRHLGIFSSNFIGLTGSTEELQPVFSAYGVYREKQKISDSAAGYLMNHTSRMYVIGPDGQWRLSIAHDAPVEDIVHDIKLLGLSK